MPTLSELLFGASVLDFSEPRIPCLLRMWKRRGYVTYDELNDVVLDCDAGFGDALEALFQTLSEMEIRVVNSVDHYFC